MSAAGKDLSRPAPVLAYPAMHALACRRALLQGLRRWGAYALMAAVLVGAGAGWDSALAAVQALAAWSVLPLFWCVARGLAVSALGTLTHGALGAALLLGMRQWLWLAQWADAERALPIAPATKRQSDLRLITLALLPWAGLNAAGAAVWVASQPAWLAGHQLLACMAMVLAWVLSVGAGLWMQHLRRAAPRPVRASGTGHRQATGRSGSMAMASRSLVRWPRTLLWWPLWRGVAPRSRSWLVMGSVAVLMLAGAAAARPQWAPWWLAAQAVLSLMLVSRLNLLTRLELAPLLQASVPLPLASARLELARQLVVAAPLLLALLVSVLAVGLTVPAGQLRVARVLGWAACLLVAGVMEMRVVDRDASMKALRWLFMGVLTVAMGSEVWR